MHCNKKFHIKIKTDELPLWVNELKLKKEKENNNFTNLFILFHSKIF
jgi:hypothetical protein